MIRSLAQTMMQTNQTVLQNNQDTQASIKNLERQMGQLSSAVSRLEAKDSGKLPSQTELNPRETVNAITLRRNVHYLIVYREQKPIVGAFRQF